MLSLELQSEKHFSFSWKLPSVFQVTEFLERWTKRRVIRCHWSLTVAFLNKFTEPCVPHAFHTKSRRYSALLYYNLVCSSIHFFPNITSRTRHTWWIVHCYDFFGLRITIIYNDAPRPIQLSIPIIIWLCVIQTQLQKIDCSKLEHESVIKKLKQQITKSQKWDYNRIYSYRKELW